MGIEWSHCADRAEAGGDPLEGSAPPADHWFLIEHRGAWGRYVLPGARLDMDPAHPLSVSLFKIANDVRWLGSGPRTCPA
jgi:hypothetical protein